MFKTQDQITGVSFSKWKKDLPDAEEKKLYSGRGGLRANSSDLHTHKKIREFTCAWCKTEFQNVQAQAKFCSNACKLKDHRAKSTVVAAVIVKNGKALLARRREHTTADCWEFPSGGLEAGENKKQAIVRQVRQLLGADIKLGARLPNIELSTANGIQTLRSFWARTDTDMFDHGFYTGFKWVELGELSQLSLTKTTGAIAMQLAKSKGKK